MEFNNKNTKSTWESEDKKAEAEIKDELNKILENQNTDEDKIETLKQEYKNLLRSHYILNDYSNEQNNLIARLQYQTIPNLQYYGTTNNDGIDAIHNIRTKYNKIPGFNSTDICSLVLGMDYVNKLLNNNILMLQQEKEVLKKDNDNMELMVQDKHKKWLKSEGEKIGLQNQLQSKDKIIEGLKSQINELISKKEKNNIFNNTDYKTPKKKPSINKALCNKRNRGSTSSKGEKNDIFNSTDYKTPIKKEANKHLGNKSNKTNSKKSLINKI